MRDLHVAAARSVFVLAGLAIGACSSAPPKVTFTSEEPGTAKLLTLANLQAPGQELGNLPVSVPRDKLTGRAVQLAAKGRSPQYWIVNADPDSRLQFKVKFLPPLPTSDGGGANHNRPFRVLMKAYQSLSSNDWKMAREYAAKLVELDPALAAPYIIVGIAALEQGKADEARTALNKARVLDPEDSEIAELLKRVN